VSTISTAHADCTTFKQSLAALLAGQEKYAQFVVELLADLEAMQQKLNEAESQIDLQSQQLAELHSRSEAELQPSAEPEPSGDQELQNKVAELESDRQALEEELENIRTRAVNMAQVIADQKRQMSEDQSQWMAEFRQLRCILDKQTKWITQQTQMGLVPTTTADASLHVESSTNNGSSALDINSDDNAAHPPKQFDHSSRGVQFPAAPQRAAGNHADPVLGSVLSQFEFLQKDVARRRKQR
jgi:DNA repair exonuclease SbcCD ATPase subunit